MTKTTETYRSAALAPDRFIALVYERYGKKLFSYGVHSWKLDEDSSWDLVYKTVYRVAEKSKTYTFESEEKFAGFVFTVFMNLLRNRFRDTRKVREQFKEEPLEQHAFLLAGETDVEEISWQRRLLDEELEQFEDWQRMLLLLRAQDIPYEQISRFVDKPSDQLKVYYQRLKKQLLDRMNKRITEFKNTTHERSA